MAGAYNYLGPSPSSQTGSYGPQYLQSIPTNYTPFSTANGYDPNKQNPDGSYVAPEYNSILNPSTGLLDSPYLLNNDLNTQGLDEYRNEALRTPGSASPWLTIAEQNQKAATMNQYDDAAAQNNSSLENAYSSIASHGGLDSGARERLAAGGMNNLLRTNQGIADQSNLANLDLQKTDEQNRLTQLAALPGMELQTAQYDNGVEQGNINNALNERNNAYQNALNTWKTQMAAYGAGKQADAQASAANASNDSPVQQFLNTITFGLL